jgi:hypothetical protein
MTLDDSSFDLLKQILTRDFVPFLPTLLHPDGRQEENNKKNLSRAFSAFVLSKVCEVPEQEAAKAVVDDFYDQGIDAIFLHGETLYLIQSKIKRTEAFKQDEALKFCRGVRQLIKSEFDQFNQHVKVRQTEIENAIDKCRDIQMVIGHIGSPVPTTTASVLNDFLKTEMVDEELLNSAYLDIDHHRTKHFLQNANAYPKVNADIVIERPQKTENPRVSYIGFVPLSDLVTLHNEHGKALYEKNIRTFLGLGRKHQVNNSIQQTLADKPQEFCYLNNGVTALCDDVTQRTERDGKRKHETKGFSVINGAQTISSAAHAARSGTDISQAKVLLTLIKADHDHDFAKRVTKARNHQNPVSLSDFAALHDDQERLRCEAACLKITYEYKAGVNDGTHDESRIRFDEAVTALALCHPDPRYAVWLKKAPEKLHSPDAIEYKSLFPPDLSVHYLINAVYFSRYLKQRVLDEENAATGSNRLTYKHGVYGLGWILAKRLKEAIDSSSLLDRELLKAKSSSPFDELRYRFETEVRREVMTSGRGALSIFRNQTHTLPLLTKVMLEDFDLTRDPVITHKQAVQDFNTVGYPKALFDYMVSKAPQIRLVRLRTGGEDTSHG